MSDNGYAALAAQTVTGPMGNDATAFVHNKQHNVHKVAEEFESIFLNQILKQSDETVDHKDNILYGGLSEDIYRGMFNQELAKIMARGGGIGIADMLEKAIAQQEAQKVKGDQ